MDEALLDLLRDDLDAAEYRTDSVRALIGPDADDARQRGVFAPARRLLDRGEPGSSLATLTRLFLLGEVVHTAALDAALPRTGARGAETLGLILKSDDGCRALLSLNPVQLPDPQHTSLEAVADWWIISDLDDQLRRGPARPDHVMGVGGATRSLIAQLSFDPDVTVPGFGSALDLGTGCGIVALFLSGAGAKQVVATDISERALMMARANARLNGFHTGIEFRFGDLFTPVADEQFDYIASNPPFVITPRSEDDAPLRYEYRDGGMTGDALAERVVREAPAHLKHGGTLICLANWESPWGTNGLDRVRTWIEGAAEDAGPLGAWVIERDRVTPAFYAETWARDGGARPGNTEFERLMTAWIDDFHARRVTAIGLGSIRINRLKDGVRAEADSEGSTTVRLEHASDPFIQHGLGASLGMTFLNGIAVSRMPDEQVLERCWIRADSVEEVRVHEPGEEGPRDIRLRTDRPLARSVVADPLLAAAVGACDGELTLQQIADALATILEVDEAACADALVEGVRELVWLGMLVRATR